MSLQVPKILHGSERDFERALTMEKVKCEENCIKEVLRNYLQREPGMNDAKICHQEIIQQDPLSYRLFYGSVYLGTVKHIVTPNKFRVEFTPKNKEN